MNFFRKPQKLVLTQFCLVFSDKKINGIEKYKHWLLTFYNHFDPHE